MADAQKLVRTGVFQNKSDIAVAGAVILIVMMLIIPIPTFLLDILIAINLLLALLTILIVLYTRNALEFSVFPTLLLVSALFGLALNVSSTRLILAQGSNFDGRIIRAFGSFVVGTAGTEGLVIGIIIFIIIIAVQFIVITKGATRVAEVAARFTLDSLPGKQMAIEAEYNSGLLTEEEARKRKRDLQRESDFYGAMDGASKFVSGNVKVGILITAINIVGGLIVGMTLHGESLTLALNTYISLTIGDGLVSQLPMLLISTATGIIVTRAVSDGTLGSDVTQQFSRQSLIYWIAGGVLLLLGLLPGFPTLILLPMAGLLGVVGYLLGRKNKQAATKTRQDAETAKTGAAAPEMSPVVPLDPLSLELGYGLIPLVDREKGAELLERITRIRRESALDLGLVVPRIRIIDNMRLDPSEYCFKIKGVEVGRGKIRMGQFLCINPGGVEETIPGEKTTDPAFGLPAVWITDDKREQAERVGYTVVDPPSIIATHLTEIIKRHGDEILGRQEVKAILDTLRAEYSAVIDEVNKVLGVGEIQKVLQNLLKEQVSIRNMVAILETLADYAAVSKDSAFLVEKVRQSLGRQICLQHADDKKVLRVVTLEGKLEQKIVESRVDTSRGPVAALEPDQQRRWISAVQKKIAALGEKGIQPVLLCSEAARPLIKRSTEREIPELAVMSVPEIVSEIKVESVGEIRLGE